MEAAVTDETWWVVPHLMAMKALLQKLDINKGLCVDTISNNDLISCGELSAAQNVNLAIRGA